MLLVSHEASQTGAPILAFNLLEKFAARYNVITVLLGPGGMENAFRNVSSVMIGPFPMKFRLTRDIHKPILNACRRFAPAFAIVNSIVSREALIPLSKAGVPSVLLVHEFVSLMRLDMAHSRHIRRSDGFPGPAGLGRCSLGFSAAGRASG